MKKNEDYQKELKLDNHKLRDELKNNKARISAKEKKLEDANAHTKTFE